MGWASHAVTLFVCAVVSPGASAQLYSQDFEADSSASWTVNLGPSDSAADFFFDYSTVGVPPAPSGAGTRGLKLQANLFNGVFGGFSVSPTGLNVSGDYVLSFDWWANFNGPFPGGGSGSTNLSTFGIGTEGAQAQWQGGVTDCLWFAATGDGGSAFDYRVYSTAAPTGYLPSSGVYFAPTNNSSDPYFAGFGGVAAPASQAALFPQQAGLTSVGSAGMQWHTVEIVKSGEVVTWSIDGLPVASIDLFIYAADLFGGNIFFGHADTNATSSTDLDAPWLLFTLIDNVTVRSASGGCSQADLAEPFGSLDFSDVLAFLSAFGAQDASADIAPPFGQWDFSDVLAFLIAYGAGCP